MKRVFCALLAALMLMDGAWALTEVDPFEDRQIEIQEPATVNVCPDGYSPTTGRLLSSYTDIPEGFGGLAAGSRYMPIMIQIDNTDGGVNARAPWGTEYADIVYETPLYRGGMTRISMLFSDVIPEAAGPCRSARVMHVWLREEWDCGFCYFGQQTYKKTSVPDEFRRLGTSKKGVLFSGTMGGSKPWLKYFKKRKGLKAPHNQTVNLARVCELIPETHEAANHTYLFTDEAPQGDQATTIHIRWGNMNYSSDLVYQPETGEYARYVTRQKGSSVRYEDYDTHEAIDFANVIVQHITCEYPSADAPLPTVTGKGNADYFIGGVHMQGVWQRETVEDRTVFYDENGKELRLKPGRTLIINLDGNVKGRSLSYE